MASQKSRQDFVPPNTLMGLPNELQARILHFAMQVNGTIKSEDPVDERNSIAIPHCSASELNASFLDTETQMPVLDPTLPLAGINGLEESAVVEFYRANVFQVRATRESDEDGPIELHDDASLRPHICHLELDVDTVDCFHQSRVYDTDGENIKVMQQLHVLYPKLLTLSISIHNIIFIELDEEQLEGRWQKPLATVVQERLDYLVSIVQALQDLPGLKERYVEHDHDTFEYREEERPPVEIDGRGRNVHELCWEILDLPNARMRL